MPRSQRSPDADQPAGKVRLQRVLADAGVAARRVCEQLIADGHVRVNAKVVRTLPVFVDPEHDRIEVDGRHVAVSNRHIYLMVNKPERVLVTAADEPGMDRATILDLVNHPFRARLFPVGRLDYHSTGLVLLTNDGTLANHLSHPRFGVPKTYHVTVKGNLSAPDLADLARKLAAQRKSAMYAGLRSRASKDAPPSRQPQITIVEAGGGRTTLEITLAEAKNRELRDVLAHLGMHVKKLERIAIGPLRLSALPRGSWRELRRDELLALRRLNKPARARTPDNQASKPRSNPRPRHPKNEPIMTESAGPRPRVIGD